MSETNRVQFEDHLAGGAVSGIYLFEGEEEHFKQEALQALRKHLLPEGLEDLNETVMEAPETDALIATAETLPFLADKRLIVVRDHPALYGRNEADDKLLEYLQHFPETCVLVLYCQAKPDKRKRLYTTVRKVGQTVSFDTLKDRELTTWITRQFQERSLSCGDRVADLLVFTSGSDAMQLLTEIEKITAHCGNRTEVLAEDVQLLATPTTECTVFQMVDALVSGQQSRALMLKHYLTVNGADPPYLLAMVLRQYRLLQHVKIMQYEKKPADFIRQQLGVQSFALDQYLRQAKMYTGGQVKQAVQLCLDTEFGFKSGRLNPDSALEALLLKLILLRGNVQ